MTRRRIPLHFTGPRATDFATALARLNNAAAVALLKRVGSMLLAASVGLGLAVEPGMVHAATITVDTTADNSTAGDGNCTLREAINNANDPDGVDTTFTDCAVGAGGAFDVVDVSNVTGTITLGDFSPEDDHLYITEPLSVIGPGAGLLTVDADTDGNGTGDSRIFSILGSAADVTITGLTLVNGFADGSGGAIFSGANLTLDGVTIQDSTATEHGGGLYASDASSTFGENITTVLVNTTVTGNIASGVGGGFCVRSVGLLGSATATMVNSTVSGNSATGSGGFCLESSAGPTSNATATLVNSTVSGNNASGSGAGGFSVYATAFYASATLTNSIVANNVAANGSSDEFDALSLTAHHSLVEGSSSPGVPNDNGNITGIDPQLGPLQDNGGPTFTHALLPGSPAIDAGDPAFVPPPDYDQRGEPFVRVYGGRVDMGSMELQVVPDLIFADGFEG